MISDPMMPIFHIIEVMLLCYISFVYYVVCRIKEYQYCIWRAASVNWGFDCRTCSYTPTREWGLYCNHLVRPSVHTFVTEISASTGRNDFIFDIWLWYGDLYRVSPFQVYRTSTSCLPCDLQMNEWGYS